MENGGNSTRALLFTLILLTLLQTAKTQEKPEKQCHKPLPPQCDNDCHDNKWFLHKGTSDCEKCPVCDPGQGLDRECGGEHGLDARCISCIPGMSFSDLSGYQCIPCRQCDNTVGDTVCNTTSDAICGPCQPGYYHERDKPDQCHPCHFLLRPELEPQCQISKESTSEPTSSVDHNIPSSSPVNAQEETEVTTKDTWTGDGGEPEEQQGDSEDNILSPETETGDGQELFDNGESNVPLAEDEKEIDIAPSSSSSSHVTTYVILAIYVVTLFMVTLSLGMCFVKVLRTYRREHSNRSVLRCHQRQSYREYQQGNVDEPSDEKDAVSLNYEDESARYMRNQPSESLRRNYSSGAVDDSAVVATVVEVDAPAVVLDASTAAATGAPVDDSATVCAVAKVDAAVASVDTSDAAEVVDVAAATVDGVDATEAVTVDAATSPTEINPAASLINQGTSTAKKDNNSSSAKKSTKSKTSRKSKRRVVPEGQDDNGMKGPSASSYFGNFINVRGNKNKVYVFGDNSRLNVGCSSSDTGSEEYFEAVMDITQIHQ